MHKNRKLFSYQWRCSESYLEFEARNNSDIDHLFLKTMAEVLIGEEKKMGGTCSLQPATDVRYW